MKGSEMKSKSGFTLVAVLIVILVIGVIAAKHMSALFVTEETTAPEAMAQASAIRIMQDIKGLKTATQAYYADNGNWPEDIDSVSSYAGRSGLSSRGFMIVATEKEMYILKEIPEDKPEVAKTLIERAETEGVSGCVSPSSLATDGPHTFTEQDRYLVIKVR
jgi:type II secretory pathway pseudopilin PulG